MGGGAGHSHSSWSKLGSSERLRCRREEEQMVVMAKWVVDERPSARARVATVDEDEREDDRHDNWRRSYLALLEMGGGEAIASVIMEKLEDDGR